MNPIAAAPAPRPPRPRRLRAAVLGCVLALTLPLGVGAQVEGGLAQAEADYRAARSAYQAALDARDAVGEQSESLLADVNRARRISGDAYEVAQQRYWSYLPELDRADARVEETRRRLEDARDALVAALDRRMELLTVQLSAATPEEEGRIIRFIEDLENQYREVEQDRGRFVSAPVFTPVDVDPRDSPQDKQLKAAILERRAREAEAQIIEITEDIERLEARLDLARRQADFEAGLGRFDADVVPVGPLTRGRERQQEAVSADSAGVSLQSLPLPQRIEALKAIRTQFENQVVVWRERARELRGTSLGRLR